MNKILNLGIESLYSPNVTPIKQVKQVLNERLLETLRKYNRDNWREQQLSRPRNPKQKYVPPEEWSPVKKELPVPDKENLFRMEHLARPKFILVKHNRELYRDRSKLRIKLEKHEEKSRHSIYRFYKQKEEERQRLRAKKSSSHVIHKPKKSRSQRSAHIRHLSSPRIRVHAEEDKKKSKVLHPDNMNRDLAVPLPRKVYEKPKPPRGIPQEVLNYIATEVIRKLAEPGRYAYGGPPVNPPRVSPEALKAIISPRVEELAKHREKRVTATADDYYDPWLIPPTALKYKATETIIKLAKHRERK